MDGLALYRVQDGGAKSFILGQEMFDVRAHLLSLANQE